MTPEDTSSRLRTACALANLSIFTPMEGRYLGGWWEFAKFVD